MMKKFECKFSPYLSDLVVPSSLGAESFILSWDLLSFELKIGMIRSLSETNFPIHLECRVLNKILDDESDYIRYLAAIRFGDVYVDGELNGRAVLSKIKFDKAPLVKNSLFEPGDNDLIPGNFFNYNQDLRLAIVRNVKGKGVAIAKLIESAVSKYIELGRVSESELHDLLVDYVLSYNFSSNYHSVCGKKYDYHALFSGERDLALDLKALWESVLLMPENLSFVFIKYLPIFNGDIFISPQRLIECLEPDQLKELLYREDLMMEKLRSYVFKNHDDSGVRASAVSHNFNLTYEDLYEVLNKEGGGEKEDMLETLLIFTGSKLRVIYYEAIVDVLESLNESWDSSCNYGLVEEELGKVEGKDRRYIILELRLYRLAKKIVPWGSRGGSDLLEEELSFFSDSTVEGDTWKTFMNYRLAWEKLNFTESIALEKYLPRINEVDGDFVELANDEDNELFGQKDCDASNQRVQNKMLMVILGLLVGIVYILSIKS